MEPSEAIPDWPHSPTEDPGDAALRRRVVAVAGHQGRLDLIDAHLGDPDPGVRAACLTALQRAGHLDDERLAAGLGDPEPIVRRRAAQLAGRHKGAAAPLAALLDDPDAWAIEMAAFALGERGEDPVAVTALCRVARDHTDPLCREAAVAALGAIGDPDALHTVLAACADRATVRRRAVLALAPYEGPQVTEALRRLSADRDLQVRQAAEDLLAIEQGEGL